MSDKINPYYEDNQDNVHKAIDGLNAFTKNYCMNVKETIEKQDLVFRCKDCIFSGKKNNGKCLIKEFAYDNDAEYTRNIDFGAMGVM